MTEPIFDHEKLEMLTRLIQRTDRAVDAAIEYEYREAEYE